MILPSLGMSFEETLELISSFLWLLFLWVGKKMIGFFSFGLVCLKSRSVSVRFLSLNEQRTNLQGGGRLGKDTQLGY